MELFFNLGDMELQISSRVWSMSILRVIFNLGNMESQLSSQLWSVSVLEIVFYLGKVRFATKPVTH